MNPLLNYFELLQILKFKKAERVSKCGEILEFDVTQEGRMKLAKTWLGLCVQRK